MRVVGKAAGERKAVRRFSLLAGLSLALAMTLTGCQRESARPVLIDIFGQPVELVEPLRHDREWAARTVLAATAQGLVAFDAQGDVIAGLAESWIVLDGGQSYIFRLRRAKWANGEPVKADAVARILQQRMKASADLLSGLKPEVRAMTDRVIEIRLQTAFPAFIQLLAQPRLALLGKQGGTGPYEAGQRDGRLYLSPLPDTIATTGESEPAEILPNDRRILETARPAVSLIRFQDGRTDMVLGGRFQHLLLLPQVRLGSTDVRVDPTPGLFGFAVTGKTPFLADRTVRDALSRAIDRAQFARDLNVQGWTVATAPLPAQLDMAAPPTGLGWASQSMPDRIAGARRTIDAWRASHGAPPMLRVALPAGAGASLLFHRLAGDFARLGLRVDRVGPTEDADLRLIDSVAGFDSALWYLAQLDCEAKIACDPDASAQLDAARRAETPEAQAQALSEAERLIVANAGFIPLGMPIRWALVSRRLDGFAPTPRAVHPLKSLIKAPN